jgi:Zn-dependent peptidase ImmA (M78 family)
MAILERGFKAWAERTAGSIRSELGLSDNAPLDLIALAEMIGVRLITPREVRGLPKDILQVLLVEDPDGWSAVSLTSGEQAVVIYNPCHSKARQSSDIAHELAHFILSHQPSKLVVSPDGQIVMRSYNSKQEEEANWLGWSLLLPREALLQAGKRKMSTPEIARTFEVSEALVSFRMGVTGVRLLQTRARSKFTRLGRD